MQVFGFRNETRETTESSVNIICSFHSLNVGWGFKSVCLYFGPYKRDVISACAKTNTIESCLEVPMIVFRWICVCSGSMYV